MKHILRARAPFQVICTQAPVAALNGFATSKGLWLDGNLNRQRAAFYPRYLQLSLMEPLTLPVIDVLVSVV